MSKYIINDGTEKHLMVPLKESGKNMTYISQIESKLDLKSMVKEIKKGCKLNKDTIRELVILNILQASATQSIVYHCPGCKWYPHNINYMSK